MRFNKPSELVAWLEENRGKKLFEKSLRDEGYIMWSNHHGYPVYYRRETGDIDPVVYDSWTNIDLVVEDWSEHIPEEGVLCWVKMHGAKKPTLSIITRGADGGYYCNQNYFWFKAEPVTVEELEKYIWKPFQQE